MGNVFREKSFYIYVLTPVLVGLMIAVPILLYFHFRPGPGELPIWVFNTETQTYMFNGSPTWNNPNNSKIEIPEYRERDGEKFYVTEIGANAFRNFRYLTEITLPDTIVEIHDSAFRNTALTEIDIPNSVVRMGHSVFRDNDKLESIYFSTNPLFIEIPADAFRDAVSLTTIELPSNIIRIGANAFNGCTELKTVTIRHTAGVVSIVYNTFANTDIYEILVMNQTVIGLYWLSDMWRWARDQNIIWVL